MGTWGSGIYDNDGALDGLASLVRLLDEETDAARLVASIGLVAWLQPVILSVHPEDVRAAVERVRDDLGSLPPETRAALAALLADPRQTIAPSSRSEAVREAIGGYSSGPRIDALLCFPGAESVITELAERAACRLDDALSRNQDLHELASDLGAVGVLLELQQAGLWRAGPERLARWRTGFDAADRATTDERSFWDRYAQRVRAGLQLLVA